MAKNNTLLFFYFSFALCTYGGRPNQNATNLVFTQKQCNSYYLNWHNGDGKARLIVAREGAVPDWEPSDHMSYPANDTFGVGTLFGHGNYVVYNSNVLNYTQIKGLKPGTTYYFKIFEHDNNGATTEYLTTSAPVAWDATYDVQPGFDVTCYDSCQASNRFHFINTSKATAPGTTYAFHFSSSDTSNLDTIEHRFTQSGIVPVKLYAYTNFIGCPSQISKTLRIYQKKLAAFDFSQLKDTLQCFYNNSFRVSTTPVINPLSGSYGYKWDYGDGDQENYSFMYHHYNTSGPFRVTLVVTTNISKGMNIYPTGCRDTLHFNARVLEDALRNAGINNLSQEIHTNVFKCNSGDSTLAGIRWLFGDNDSSMLYKISHTYQDTGRYNVTLSATNPKDGCYGEKIFPVYVYDTTTLTGIDYIPARILNIYPNPSKGLFIVDTHAASQLEVYNTEGKVVYTTLTGTGPLTEIDLSCLGKGIYLLRLQFNDSSCRDKMILIE